MTITDIFKNIASFVNDSSIYLAGSCDHRHSCLNLTGFSVVYLDVMKSDKELLAMDKYKDSQQLKEKVSRILSIISRDHMKVVFFGRFSF